MAPAVLLVGVTNAALDTETGKCVGTNLILESSWVEQGVGQDASLRDCGSVLVEEVSAVVDLAVNFVVDGASQAVDGTKRIVSWLNPFG